MQMQMQPEHDKRHLLCREIRSSWNASARDAMLMKSTMRSGAVRFSKAFKRFQPFPCC